jgi:hypothetical protein
MGDYDIEVEYQSDTIGKYGLEYDGTNFQLTLKNTACLASDACGVTEAKKKVNLSDLQQTNTGCCSTEAKCC